MSYTDTDIQHAIADSIRAIFERNIHDDGGPAPGVTRLFDANEWGSWLRHPERGGCPNGYTRPPDPDYCGHTAACAARLIGDHLAENRCVGLTIDPEICREILPSTYRLANATHWEDAGYVPPHRYDRRVDGEPPAPRRGEIVVVGDDKIYGDHIVVCDGGVSGGRFPTVEGNAAGRRADDTRGKGVVERSRAVADIAQIIPLGMTHTVEMTP